MTFREQHGIPLRLGSVAGAPVVTAKPPKYSEAERTAVAMVDAAIRRGVGDDVAKVAEWLGADKAAAFYEKMTGKSCGCAARRKWLNEFWPYKSALQPS